MNEIVEIAIKKIKIKTRIRKDLGDIEPLKKSIIRLGLLSPLIVSDAYELLAGRRRLEAIKQLSWKTVPIIIVKTKSRLKKLDIELEENFARKDFTYSEIEEGLEQRRRLRRKQELPFIVRFFVSILDFFARILRALFRKKEKNE